MNMKYIEPLAFALGAVLLLVLLAYAPIFLDLAVTGDYTPGFRLMTGLEEDSVIVSWIIGLAD